MNLVMSRKVGYIRALGGEIALVEQQEALRRAGCAEVYVDLSPADAESSQEWSASLSGLNEGDCLVVPRLEHLGFTLEQLAGTLADLIDRSVRLEICDWALASRLDVMTLVEIVQRLDAFERAGRREQIHVGLSAARAQGRAGGRRHKLTQDQVQELKRLMAAPGADPVEVGMRFGLGRASVYRYLKR